MAFNSQRITLTMSRGGLIAAVYKSSCLMLLYRNIKKRAKQDVKELLLMEETGK